MDRAPGRPRDATPPGGGAACHGAWGANLPGGALPSQPCGDLLLLLALAACSGAPAGPCRRQPVADLPATLDGNRLEVAARVDGADTRMLVDTAARRRC